MATTEMNLTEADTSSPDYHALNAMLNLFDAEGRIQFDKDRLAARQYFLQHVNQNTVFFHNLAEKLRYLVEEGYYEAAVLDQYAFDDIKALFKQAYAKTFFNSFNHPYRTVGRAAAYPGLGFICHKYNKLTKKQGSKAFDRSTVRLPLISKSV